jgi:simple sugar transport system substrate-binding protein
MAKSERREVDPKVREFSRRRFMRNAGITAAAVPLLGGLGDIFSGSGAQAASSIATKNPFPTYPAYRFAMVCHVTADPFFNACRSGATDACNLLGTSYTWSGSENDIVPEMVDAFNVAIDDKVNGIACCIVDPTAFNSVTDKALAAGIPVIAYNAESPTGKGNNAMAYIGQDLYKAGVAVGQKIATYVKKGDLVGGMISVPGSLNEQPRMDGAASVFKAAGIDFVQVGVGATEGPALATTEAWYHGHPDVKFMFSSGGSNGIAVATCIEKLGLAAKGVGGAAFDVGVPVLQQIAAGHLVFTVDQQAYFQGFLSIVELFYYNISGGLFSPMNVNTGMKYVTKDTVNMYLQNKDSWEGSSTSPVVFTPPKTISLPQGQGTGN